jgi:DNA-3-methyladenine glycosylase I
MIGTGAAPDLVRGADGRARCWWAGDDDILTAYHDREWGRGPRDETSLFERLSLEAFQAGLSWRLVLQRREELRRAFADFEPAALGRLTDDDIGRILTLPGVIRNRAKVAAVVANARVLTRLHASGSGLAALTAEVMDDVPIVVAPRPRRRADVPSSTVTSIALARRLRATGWRFVGPVTAYAYLQAAGWVDDHLAGCHAQRSDGPGASLR